ncbi:MULTISPECIES: hypothetical protein [Mycobacteriaceae]|uniref:hypothetical protein n=1 Tax=Mycobacteriaceae TaxID=1762 RepID=UPI0009424682|nr:hypothetical protein [Mycobacteroides abscessus]
MCQPHGASEFLLLAMDSAEFGAHSARLPRIPWVARLLVEQLIAELPDGHARETILTLRDPQRGVTDRRLAPVMEQLAALAFIEPFGSFDNAVWMVADRGRAAADTLWCEITPAEAESVRTATQRAMAIFVAWSKTSRA